jgi:hypothetical protein
MTNQGLKRRLDSLEAAHNDDAMLMIWRNTGESAEQAKTRWHAEHPEKGDPKKSGARVLIVGWGDPTTTESL